MSEKERERGERYSTYLLSGKTYESDEAVLVVGHGVGRACGAAQPKATGKEQHVKSCSGAEELVRALEGPASLHATDEEEGMGQAGCSRRRVQRRPTLDPDRSSSSRCGRLKSLGASIDVGTED